MIQLFVYTIYKQRCHTFCALANGVDKLKPGTWGPFAGWS